MSRYVIGLEELDRTQVALAGGKGALLGELTRVDGVQVPAGFCVTTEAYRRTMAGAPPFEDRLWGIDPDDRDGVSARSAEVRATIESTAIPGEVAAGIIEALVRLGAHRAWAVRSSATGEDSPMASFAGLGDSFLDVTGPTAVLHAVRRCWASLYTDRAVTYRLRNGVDRRAVDMAVVVQRMVPAEASGVLFTADPLTSNRTVTSIEATSGPGDALVAGRATPDTYRVRGSEIVDTTAGADGRVLTDEQVRRLAQLGRRIEAHFDHPQDIEWCLVDDDLQVVQSRPITTLFPIPDAADGDHHVYVSVGHQQMMTDAMTPLGLSLWQMTTPRPMAEAGGRLFVDVTDALARPASRAALVEALGKSDPLMGDALQTILDRGDFVPSLPDEGPGWSPPGAGSEPLDPDPAIVEELIAESQASIDGARRDIEARSGPALFDVIRSDVEELRRVLFSPRSLQVIMSGMEATWWLDERLEEWLGEQDVADRLAQSVPHNVTSEMGLALMDVADAVRPHPEVVAFLEQVGDDDFLDRLPGLDGGREARDAIGAFLDEYGVRCVGEIDVTRPRWSERPGALVPAILSNVRNFGAGAAVRRFEQGRREALDTEQDVLDRLRSLPDGEAKAQQAKVMIDRVRTFSGYREYPKFGMVTRYFVYKQAMLREAERLVRDRVLGEPEDMYFLRFDELSDVVRTGRADRDLIRRRRDDFRRYQALRPPRVLTSHGEVLVGSYRRDDLPAGAMAGLAVSAGTAEGRARVVSNMGDAAFEPGDILVTAYTDPSWTPVFVGIAGVVTEVGGLMTHGAVIAREYGLPAVVGVPDATRRIRDGQRIRIDGTHGIVELR